MPTTRVVMGLETTATTFQLLTLFLFLDLDLVPFLDLLLSQVLFQPG